MKETPGLRFILCRRYRDISQLIEGPYNPPSSTVSDAEFQQEYERARGVLVRHLTEIGTVGEGSTEIDFGVGWPTGRSRGIGVVVLNYGLIGISLAKACFAAVQAIKQEYVVALSGNYEAGLEFYVAFLKNGSVYGYVPANRDLVSLIALGFRAEHGGPKRPHTCSKDACCSAALRQNKSCA